MTTPPKDNKSTQLSQSEKFKAAARELETNNDPAAFDRKMKGMKLQTKKPSKSKTKLRD